MMNSAYLSSIAVVPFEVHPAEHQFNRMTPALPDQGCATIGRLGVISLPSFLNGWTRWHLRVSCARNAYSAGKVLASRS
jgi:hypothetical protein